MSVTLLVVTPSAPDRALCDLARDDPRVERVLTVSGPEALAAATSPDGGRFCAVIDLADAGGLDCVDVLHSADPDITIVVSVPHDDHTLGLAAIRHGAQDYVTRASSGHHDIAGLTRALNAAIERSNLVVRRLREHRRMAKVLEHAGEGYLVVDPHGAVLTSSPSLARIWPDGFDHLTTIFDALHPEDRDRARDLGTDALAHPGVPAVGEVRAIDATGQEHWFEIRINDQSTDPAIGGLITNVRDITDRVRSEQERHRAEAWFRLGFDHAAVGMAMAGLDGRLTQVNDALSTMLGRPSEELLGRRLDDLLHPSAPPVAPLRERLVAQQVSSIHLERQLLRADGTSVWVVATTVLVPGGEGAGAALYTQFQDVTDQKTSADALAHQAAHDALTGLPNRAQLEQRLAAAISEDTEPPTVLFIDIDNFNVINDGLGHTVGDRILVALAERLRSSVRADDTAARFGGDEFAVVLRGLPGPEPALARAERLLDELGQRLVIDGETHFVSVSIGVARAGSGASPETVLRDADAAVHQAKVLGRDRVQLFEASLHSRAERRLRTATRMRHALDRGHFHVAYQPFITVADERVIGMEALLRWDDPEAGAISPSEFIPVAEQTGLIVQLGAWALDQAVRQLSTWRVERPWGPGLSLSVNLSARQLVADGLVDSVQRSIVSNGVDAGLLCLEITETAVMSDIETSIGLMRMMRSLGVELSIDDFGTGYSSLNYLKSLPLTTLKVDRSFIDGLGRDPHDTSIVEAVVALGHALGMRVHAEGVERRDQLAELQRIGCDDAQGWLWAPAMSAGDFEAWMEGRSGG